MGLATLPSPNCMPPKTAATRSNLNSPTRPQLSPPTIVRIAAAALSFLMDSPSVELLSSFCTESAAMAALLSRVCTVIVDCLYSTGVNEQERHQARADPGSGFLRIGELARRTGVSPELLRAWEQRDGALQTTRTPGGFSVCSA